MWYQRIRDRYRARGSNRPRTTDKSNVKLRVRTPSHPDRRNFPIRVASVTCFRRLYRISLACWRTSRDVCVASGFFNIESLAVGETENTQLSRITVVVMGDDRHLEQVRKQLEKIVTVVKVHDISSED